MVRKRSKSSPKVAKPTAEADALARIFARTRTLAVPQTQPVLSLIDALFLKSVVAALEPPVQRLKASGLSGSCPYQNTGRLGLRMAASRRRPQPRAGVARLEQGVSGHARCPSQNLQISKAPRPAVDETETPKASTQGVIRRA